MPSLSQSTFVFPKIVKNLQSFAKATWKYQDQMTDADYCTDVAVDGLRMLKEYWEKMCGGRYYETFARSSANPQNPPHELTNENVCHANPVHS